MRRILLIVTFLLVALGVSPVLAADPLSELKSAEYLSIEDVSAVLPHGRLYIADGVVGIFPGLEERLSGVLIGNARIDWSTLPVGEGALNLFNELGLDDSGSVPINVARAYLSASPYGGAQIIPSGFTRAIRSWSELSSAEQEEFTAVYLMARSDGWLPAPSGPPMGMGGAKRDFRLRDPVDKEVFLAAWDKSGTRWDYKVNADASETSIKDYTRNTTYVQVPWDTTVWQMEENVTFSSVDFGYTFGPSWPEPLQESDGRKTGGYIECEARASFSVAAPASSITIYSNPSFPPAYVTLRDGSGNKLASKAEFGSHGATGLDAWEVRLTADFKPGVEYVLSVGSEGRTSANYYSVGYGGAYRFDTTLLWPGEGVPVDLSISAQLAELDSTAISSGQVALQAGTDELLGGKKYTASWPGSTRNQMLVLTQFPSQLIPTSWGELEVFAPLDMQGDIESLEAVQAIGPIVQYYTELWGERSVTRLPVFIIPDETGVQGFEDAGMVFILGGTGGHGGAGGAMGGLTALMAHELAHLWWGYDVSGPRWFGEALANYGASKYLAHEASQGLGSNVDDPYFYRRYIMNFALANELPLSMERRDALDDEAAIYHNGPACLLTLDELRPYGIDGILKQLHAAGTGMPEISHAELRGIFADLGGDEMAGWWGAYIEQGLIPAADVEDTTYRRLEHTIERDDYQNLLGWLMPARRKQYTGDTHGALYCAERALDFRREPKDFIYIADLTYQVGNHDEALERCMALLENPSCDALNRIKAHWIMAQVYRAEGDMESEQLELEYIAEMGPAAGAMYETGQARERLAELTGEALPEPDAQTGATPNPHGG